jgi:hypothetical protein
LRAQIESAIENMVYWFHGRSLHRGRIVAAAAANRVDSGRTNWKKRINLKEKAMRFRTAFVCTLGLAAGTFAVAGHARGISIDETITCASVAVSTGGPFVFPPGTGPKSNSVSTGVNFPVLVCADSVAGDGSITSLPYLPNKSFVYTWVDLSLAGIAASSLTGPASNPNTPPLSNFSGLNVSINAQVEVLKLTGAYAGDYEIIFNYETSPEVACDNVFHQITPAMKWHNKTYDFTGDGGVTPCDSSATNDFLFNSAGVLLGYNSAPDFSGFVLTAGLPPGWVLK